MGEQPPPRFKCAACLTRPTARLRRPTRQQRRGLSLRRGGRGRGRAVGATVVGPPDRPPSWRRNALTERADENHAAQRRDEEEAEEGAQRHLGAVPAKERARAADDAHAGRRRRRRRGRRGKDEARRRRGRTRVGRARRKGDARQRGAADEAREISGALAGVSKGQGGGAGARWGLTFLRTSCRSASVPSAARRARRAGGGAPARRRREKPSGRVKMERVVMKLWGVRDKPACGVAPAAEALEP